MDKPVKPTIIILENSVGFTGAFKAIVQIAEDLSDDFNFVFVIPKGSLVIEELMQKNINFYEVPYYPIKRSFKNLLLYIPYLILNGISLLKIAYKEKSTLIHSNDLYNLAPIITKIISFNRIKFITHVRFLSHNFPKKLFNTWLYLNKTFAEKIICVSRAAYEPLKGNKKSEIIYGRNPINEKYPYSYPSENQSPISLLYLANYTKGKGQILAIDSFALVLKKVPNVTLNFIGDDFGLQKNKEFRQGLMDQAKGYGILENIMFEDFKTDSELEFKKNDIFLNLSFSESFSNTCMESLFYGVPCIATASGGPQEILDYGNHGILIYDRNPELVADSIIELINNPDKRKALSLSGRQFTREKFSIENTSYKMKAIYLSLFN